MAFRKVLRYVIAVLFYYCTSVYVNKLNPLVLLSDMHKINCDVLSKVLSFQLYH